MSDMNRIKHTRVMKGISQKEVAISIGVTQSALSGWESGRYNPSYDKLLQLAKMYGVSVDYLLENDDTEAAISGAINITGKQEDTEPIQNTLDHGESDLLAALSPENKKKALEYIKYLEFQQFSGK